MLQQKPGHLQKIQWPFQNKAQRPRSDTVSKQMVHFKFRLQTSKITQKWQCYSSLQDIQVYWQSPVLKAFHPHRIKWSLRQFWQPNIHITSDYEPEISWHMTCWFVCVLIAHAEPEPARHGGDWAVLAAGHVPAAGGGPWAHTPPAQHQSAAGTGTAPGSNTLTGPPTTLAFYVLNATVILHSIWGSG